MNLTPEETQKLVGELRSLKDRRGFMKGGYPRYNRLFGRDSLIAAWQLLDWNPGICKATLGVLSQLQGEVISEEREEEPGKILHETDLEESRHPDDYFPFPYYGSVDSTPLFVIVFAKYLARTKDRTFLKAHWDNVVMALHWMVEYGDADEDYFLEYARRNPRGMFHQGWKDGLEDHLSITPPVELVEVQGYQYLALKEGARLAGAMGDGEFAEELEVRAGALKEALNEQFWMDDASFFALALDGAKKQRRAITSNPGHLLFCGIVEEERAALLVRRLFQEDLWTPYGIRTHSTEEPDFDPASYHLGSVWPHDNWIIAQGLKKLGYAAEYEQIKTATVKAFRRLGFLPERYGVVDGTITVQLLSPTPSYPQSWATGALVNFAGMKSGAARRIRTLFRW